MNFLVKSFYVYITYPTWIPLDPNPQGFDDGWKRIKRNVCAWLYHLCVTTTNTTIRRTYKSTSSPSVFWARNSFFVIECTKKWLCASYPIRIRTKEPIKRINWIKINEPSSLSLFLNPQYISRKQLIPFCVTIPNVYICLYLNLKQTFQNCRFSCRTIDLYLYWFITTW